MTEIKPVAVEQRDAIDFCNEAFRNTDWIDTIDRELLEDVQGALATFVRRRASLQPAPSDAGLREALVKARDLLDCIEQRSADNFWWVNADDPETAVCDTYSAIHAALLQAESLWPADWPFAERLAEFLSRGPYEQETIQRNKLASIVMLSYNDLLADAKELLAALQSSQPPTSLDGEQEKS